MTGIYMTISKLAMCDEKIGLAARLTPEPDNEYDKMAILVEIDWGNVFKPVGSPVNSQTLDCLIIISYMVRGSSWPGKLRKSVITPPGRYQKSLE